MLAWDIVNSLIRLALAVLLVWKLHRYHYMFNACERWGMGITAGCGLLTITVIWDAQRSPFDGWGTTLFSVGVLLYFFGRATRCVGLMLGR